MANQSSSVADRASKTVSSGLNSVLSFGGTAIDSATQKADSFIDPAIDSVSSGMDSALNGVNSGLNSATGFIGNSAGKLENYANQGINAITTPLGNMIGKGENLVGGAVSAVSGLAGKAVDSISGSVTGITSSLFGKSNVSKKAAKLSTTTKDALKATTAKGTPRSTAFKMNGSFSQTDPINLKVKKPSLGGALSSLSNLANRFGGIANSVGNLGKSAESSIMGKVGDITHSNLLQGVSKEVSGGLGAVTNLRQSINNTMSSVTSVPRMLESSVAEDWKKISYPISNAVAGVPNSLDDFYDSKLLSTTDGNGNAIDGVPSNMGTSQIASYYNMAKNLGCEITHPSVFANAAETSLRGSLLGIASTFDMHDLLRGLTKCPQFGFAWQNYGVSLFKGIFSHKVKSGAIVASTISPTLQPLDATLAKSTVQSSDVKDSSTVDAVTSTFDYFKVPRVQPYVSTTSTGQSGKPSLSRYAIQKLNSLITQRPTLLVDTIVSDEKSGPSSSELAQAASMGGAVLTNSSLIAYSTLEINQQISYGIDPNKTDNADATQQGWQDIADAVDSGYLDNNLTTNKVKDDTTEFLNTNKTNLPVLYSELTTKPTYIDVAKAYYQGGGVLTEKGFVTYAMLGNGFGSPLKMKSLKDESALSWAMSGNQSGQYIVDMPVVKDETQNGKTSQVLVYNDSVITNSYKPLVSAMTGNDTLTKTIGGTVVA